MQMPGWDVYDAGYREGVLPGIRYRFCAALNLPPVRLCAARCDVDK